MQFLIRRQSKQLLIRHGAPQEVGQATRERVVIQPPVFVFLAEKQKVRRNEHGLQPHTHRLLKGVTRIQSLPHPGKQRLDVLVRHGTTKGSPGKLPQNALGIWQRIFGNDLAPVGIILLGHVLLLQIAKQSHMTRWRP